MVKPNRAKIECYQTSYEYDDVNNIINYLKI